MSEDKLLVEPLPGREIFVENSLIDEDKDSAIDFKVVNNPELFLRNNILNRISDIVNPRNLSIISDCYDKAFNNALVCSKSEFPNVIRHFYKNIKQSRLLNNETLKYLKEEVINYLNFYNKQGDCFVKFCQEYDKVNRIDKYLNEVKIHKLEKSERNKLKTSRISSCVYCNNILEKADRDFKIMLKDRNRLKMNLGL